MTSNHVERQGRIYVFNLSSAACDKLILRAVITANISRIFTLNQWAKVDFHLHSQPTHSRQPRQYILGRVLPVTVRKQTGATATKSKWRFFVQNTLLLMKMTRINTFCPWSSRNIYQFTKRHDYWLHYRLELKLKMFYLPENTTRLYNNAESSVVHLAHIDHSLAVLSKTQVKKTMRLAPKILWTTPIYHSSRLSVSINTVFIANGCTLCKSNSVSKMLSVVKIKIVWQTLRRRPRHCLSAVLSIFVKTKMATPSTEYDQQRPPATSLSFYPEGATRTVGRRVVFNSTGLICDVTPSGVTFCVITRSWWLVNWF